MSFTVEEWANREAGRIARIALCVPEELRGAYIARKMIEALTELVSQAEQFPALPEPD